MSSRSARAQWMNAVVFAATALLWFVLNRSGGAGSVIVPIVLLMVAVVSSPVFKRKSVSHDIAQAAGADVVIYHRPGCTFCIKMKMQLGSTGKKATWVDIWEDEDAAAFVRSVKRWQRNRANRGGQRHRPHQPNPQLRPHCALRVGRR